MNALPATTRRRLQRLRQLPHLWEGDCLPLSDFGESSPQTSHCILWVDTLSGVVRAMDIVSGPLEPEMIVRVLLQAMEHPQGNVPPARPQKLLVRNREVQFFLRGVLQELAITVEYAPQLPLIEQIFQDLREAILPQESPEPAGLAELGALAERLWQEAPWELLADHQILSIDLNHWDLGTLYASILGQGGMEYGVLLYRSLDSLRQFRQHALRNQEFEQMEAVFLRQDCLYLTYEPVDETLLEQGNFNLRQLPPDEVQPDFGTIHPLEGIRPLLYAEEVWATYVCLEALSRFWKRQRTKFVGDQFPSLSSNLQIPLPATATEEPGQLTVTIATQPELTAELFQMQSEAAAELGNDLEDLLPVIRDDLVPEDSVISLGALPWDTLDSLRSLAQHYQAGTVNSAGDGLPILLIQTSQPKAKTLIAQLQSGGGVSAIGFNPGANPFSGERYELGIIQTEDGQMQLFGEFSDTDRTHQQARKKWDQRCQRTRGWCGLVIAKGSKGSSRGNPQLRDMLALYEIRFRSAQELDLGTLQMLPQWD